jgi:hypothetical protein
MQRLTKLGVCPQITQIDADEDVSFSLSASICAANGGESYKSNKIFAAKERKERKDKNL